MTKKKDPADLKKRGRPTAYTPELGVAICELLCDGTSINKISKRKDMPARSTILKWLRDVPEFSALYARAREIGMDCLFDEIIDLADAAENIDKDQCRRNQLRIDTRKWFLAKFAPKKYGDRITQVQVGDKEEDPIQTENKTQLSIEDYRKAREEMLKRDDC